MSTKTTNNSSQFKHEHICIGDVFLVDFNGIGNEQKGIRPAVVFQNNLGNEHSPNVVVLPLTSSIKKTNLPTHVVIPKEVGLIKESMVLCENPKVVPKDQLGNYLLTIPDEYMQKIAIANLLASGAISFINPELLVGSGREPVALNNIVV